MSTEQEAAAYISILIGMSPLILVLVWFYGRYWHQSIRFKELEQAYEGRRDRHGDLSKADEERFLVEWEEIENSWW